MIGYTRAEFEVAKQGITVQRGVPRYYTRITPVARRRQADNIVAKTPAQRGGCQTLAALNPQCQPAQPADVARQWADSLLT